MDRSTAGKLYNASLDTPLFHLEDIYVTGILSSKVHIRLVSSPDLEAFFPISFHIKNLVRHTPKVKLIISY